MDHGCHQVEPTLTPKGTIKCGTHGEEIPEDLNVVHHYKVYPATK